MLYAVCCTAYSSKKVVLEVSQDPRFCPDVARHTPHIPTRSSKLSALDSGAQRVIIDESGLSWAFSIYIHHKKLFLVALCSRLIYLLLESVISSHLTALASWKIESKL